MVYVLHLFAASFPSPQVWMGDAMQQQRPQARPALGSWPPSTISACLFAPLVFLRPGVLLSVGLGGGGGGGGAPPVVDDFRCCSPRSRLELPCSDLLHPSNKYKKSSFTAWNSFLLAVCRSFLWNGQNNKWLAGWHWSFVEEASSFGHTSQTTLLCALSLRIDNLVTWMNHLAFTAWDRGPVSINNSWEQWGLVLKWGLKSFWHFGT